MFFNNLKITLRQFLKYKTFTFVNLLGLTIGFTSVILMGLYVQKELSYDQYHSKKDQLYRMAAAVEGASYGTGIAKVTYNWGKTALEEIPEVANMCRFTFFGRTLVTKGRDQNYERGGFYTDASVFKMFDWELIQGEPKTALEAPNSLVLTESFAAKYFPDENPIGQSLNFDNEQDLTITGIVKDPPNNSHFTFNFLVSLSSYSHPYLLDWQRWNQSYTYLELKKEASPEMVAVKMDAILDKNLPEDVAENTSPLLQPITDIHLNSKLHREMSVNSDASYLYIFSAIALFILIVACLNFINLTTARAADRAKEVGVRKAIGASKSALIGQFLSESILICLLAGAAAFQLAQMVLPFINSFTGMELALNLGGNTNFLINLILITILTGLLSGAYPAFFLSRFRPTQVLKGNFSFSKNANLKKGLVIFQFAIAGFLIIATLVVFQQLEYIQNKNLGFNKEQIIVIPMQDLSLNQKTETIKEELSKISGVVNVTASANRPGGSDYGVPYTALGVPENEQPSMRCLIIDEDFLKTYGIEMAEGRGFSEDFSTDSVAYLINETAAKQFPWENPVGQKLSMEAANRGEGPIVGVVKDFHFRSMHEKIAPLYFFIEKSWFSEFSIKLDAQNLNKTLAEIEQTWKQFQPNYPFTYRFFDSSFEALHSQEEATSTMIWWFTMIAIFITCLGLFALSTYTAAQRSREIGIRKVLGASVGSIVAMLTKDYLKLVIIALLVAAPVAYYFSAQWLQNFAYHIDFQWTLLALAAMISIGIAFLTVGFQSFRAASVNPVESLKNE